MKQYAIIGVSKFGLRMIDELSQLDCELIAIDKNKDVINAVKDKVHSVFIADVVNEELIRKIIPAGIDGAVIDLGDRIEVSLLVVNYLKKMGVRTIIAKAETDEHGEILEIIGATHVIFPNREAAKRIAPIIASSQLFSFLPISPGLVIAEVQVPVKYFGKTLIEADLRRSCNLNAIAVRDQDTGDYRYFSPDYVLKAADVLLVAGSEEAVTAFSGLEHKSRGLGIGGLFRRLMNRQ